MEDLSGFTLKYRQAGRGEASGRVFHQRRRPGPESGHLPRPCLPADNPAGCGCLLPLVFCVCFLVSCVLDLLITCSRHVCVSCTCRSPEHAGTLLIEVERKTPFE
ncbi:adenylate cyclase type 1 isoform X2 [Camelus dromedarius]|uniref:adenylate cyclase type 1 isoform X2 n=1 Tax=Camelus dromedarius TaxID=9838 RepID=UPI00311A7B47